MADQADAAARDVTANREAWTQINAAYTDDRAYRAWMASEIAWGIFNVPESQLGVLGEVRGLDVVELGCGTAYFSAWLARRGARPVGVDVTAAQLAELAAEVMAGAFGPGSRGGRQACRGGTRAAATVILRGRSAAATGAGLRPGRGTARGGTGDPAGGEQPGYQRQRAAGQDRGVQAERGGEQAGRHRAEGVAEVAPEPVDPEALGPAVRVRKVGRPRRSGPGRPSPCRPRAARR